MSCGPPLSGRRTLNKRRRRALAGLPTIWYAQPVRRRASSWAAIAGAVVTLGACGAGVAARRAADPIVSRAQALARDAPCDHPTRTRYSYHWPIKPFDRQHPIRGNFGDPRTVSKEGREEGIPSPGSHGSFNFHNGVDISATTGTAVYPVVSGVARIGFADEVIVRTFDFRTFQYLHIRPRVHDGQRVTAYKTILGTVRPRWLHVHLSEIDGFRIHNPADPGHLEPYRDGTIPAVDDITFTGVRGTELDPSSLHGKILISAGASDLPPISVPGYWFDFPVTPALVTWRMASPKAPVVRRTTVADFRHTEPPPRDYWRIYASGTYQNFPAIGGDVHFRLPGRYLFNLTPTPLDTRHVPNGRYSITAYVADVCGNHSSITERVRIDNS